MALNQNIGKLSVDIAADASKFNNELKKVSSGVKTMSSQMASAGNILKTAFAGFSIAYIGKQFYDVTKAAFDYVDQISDLADQTKLSTSTIQELRYAMIGFGATAEQVDAGLAKFVQSMGQAQVKGGALKGIFDRLGVDIKLPPTEAFEKFLEQLARVPNEAQRIKAASQILGDELGPKIATALGQGIKALQDLRREAAAVGFVIDEETIRKSGEVSDKMAILAQVLKVQLYQGLLAVTPQLEEFVNHIKDNPESIKQFGQNVGTIVSAMASFAETLAGTIERMQELANILSFIDKMTIFDKVMAIAKINPALIIANSISGNKPPTTAESIVAQQNAEFANYKFPKPKPQPQPLPTINLPDIDLEGAGKRGGGADKAEAEAKKLQDLYDKYANLNSIVQQYLDMKRDLNQLEAAGKMDAQQRADIEANYTKNLLASYEALIDPIFQVKQELQKIGEIEEAGLINAEKRQEYKAALLEKEASQYLAMIEPLYNYNKELERLTDLYRLGALSTEQFQAAQQKLWEEMTPAGQKLKELGDGLADAFGSAFSDLIKGGKDFDEVLKNLAERVLELMTQIIIIEPLIQSLKAAMSSAGGGTGLLQGIASFLGFASGGVFQGGDVTPFARGGVVAHPTLFPMARGMGLMGEAGPEAVMPLARTADGKLGVKAEGGGGSVPVSIEIVNKGTPQQATSATGNMSPDGLVISVITQDLTKGGRFSSTIERTYGLRRK